MPRQIPSFDEYRSLLGRLTPHVDPTLETDEALKLRAAAESLDLLPVISIDTLEQWFQENPESVPAIGLAVGLTQEKLRNTLTDHFQTAGWVTLARKRPRELAIMFDEQYDLLRLLEKQRKRNYDFGDILIARAGTRVLAARAGASGRNVEDKIEEIAVTSVWLMRPELDLQGATTGPRPAISLSRAHRMPRLWLRQRGSILPAPSSLMQSGRWKRWQMYAFRVSTSTQ